MTEYISKERAKHFVCEHCNEICSDEPCEPSECDWMHWIDREPAADVAPVLHGRWICVETEEEQFYLCNECKDKEYWESDYCPKCGAKMDKEDKL